MRPLVSIIVPCYNQGSFLSDTLKSVLHQSYSNWECIIVNDGSTDDTENIALRFSDQDERFKYHKKSNGGLSSARNAAISLCSGDLIQFLDSDDWIDKDKLKESVECFKNTDSKVVISNFKIFDSRLQTLHPPFSDLSKIDFSYKSLLLHWDIYYTIPIHTAIFKTELFRTFRFDTNLKAKEDWLMWLHLFRISEQVSFINKPYAIYRVHPAGMTRDKLPMLKNSAIAFNTIFNTLPDSELKKLFYDRTNEFWLIEYKRLMYEKTIQHKMKACIKYLIGVYGAIRSKLFNQIYCKKR